ncbi:hypothetical protein AFA_12650 [Alcaligenes faecalis]|uniref:Uncharacterized protein n=1 Tax=Alcaligenes faecalis TaxID=511 RepID=A0AB33CWE1_ALCFA|nr:hypothetical protein AFA_12650 [Alcaligenes faecalis]
MLVLLSARRTVGRSWLYLAETVMVNGLGLYQAVAVCKQDSDAAPLPCLKTDRSASVKAHDSVL